MPYPQGSTDCTICKKPIKICRHEKYLPDNRPLAQHDCGGWWRCGYCECPSPAFMKKDDAIWCGNCSLKVKLCYCPGAEVPEIGGENEECPSCGGWRKKQYCRCAMPYPQGSTSCTVCSLPIKACPHKKYAPDDRPLDQDSCGGWWRCGYCECTSPVFANRSGAVWCDNCELQVKVCSCSEASAPIPDGENERCSRCGNWREKQYCRCANPYPQGSTSCTVCSRPIKACPHKKYAPDNRPLSQDNCGGWWRCGYCECTSPVFANRNGAVWCDKCELKVRVCSCFGSSPPVPGGDNERCNSCGKWRKKMSDFLRWLIELWYRIKSLFRSYTLTDWFYFFRYFLTGYHLECADPSNMTSREVYIKSLDSVFHGDYPTQTQREYEAVQSLHLWSFLGMRFAFFIGNPVGGDDRYEYCTIACRYPFLGYKGVMMLPKNPSECARAFRQELNKRGKYPHNFKWKGELTYFPEPNDEYSHAAEKFASEFRKAIHSGDLERAKEMMVPGSPVSNMSVDAIRARLPLSGRPGRSSSPWSDVRLVPFMIVNGDTARSALVMVEQLWGKLYISEIR